MSQQELLIKVIQVLNEAGIQYMITGSVASSMQGEPRSTHDIDLVAAINKTSIEQLMKAFPNSDFYLERESIVDAIKDQTMFNLIDLNSGDKVDFWMLTDDAFDKSRFTRKLDEEFAGYKIQISSPEDTILAKLKWAKLSGGSEKQFVDALRIFEVQYENLDIDYIKKWISKLNIESLWQRLTEEAKIL